MANELTVIETDILNVDEKNELNDSIDRIIAAHKSNRQEINRLVFESVAAMTEADQAQEKLSNKGFFRRFIGGITGSNQKLQNKINSNRAVVQYAAQQTLQKLAEQNLMTFDLITAVNNKLNASIYDINTEFNRIYTGLEKFFKHSRNEIIRLETRLARVEQNVQLLTWQNSIEYLEFDGEEYLDMDDTKKIVCLTRDFFDITKGNWTTSDLLLLK
ncbi:sel1 repeat family protein, partial [Megamonas hypermegale]|nr:sel1 repeat family protein [Megamonas hypermegale]